MNKQTLVLRKSQNIEEAFQLMSQKLEQPSSKYMIMKTRSISIDPIMRVWISGAKTYLPALKDGDVIHGFAISSPIDNPNDLYFGPSGLQTHFLYEINSKNQLVKIPRAMKVKLQKCGLNPQHFLTIIMNGLPAYYGLIDFCKIQKGQNVVVSAAAGATGLLCIQLALNMDCNVIALTGSQEKVTFLQQNFPKLKVINYKQPNWETEIESNIDCYFDNVGESMLDALLQKMKPFGRIALCGSMGSSANYNQRKGLSNAGQIVLKRLKLKGITFNQELNKIAAALDYLFTELLQKRIIIKLEEYTQLSDAPKALKRLFMGQNIGKLIINLENIQNAKL